jgi:hypothetical protein
MRKQMYSLLDHTAQIFLNPISFLNDGDAIRWFTSLVNAEDDKSNVAQYPEQFSLYRLADFDDKNGTYHPQDSERQLAVNKDLTESDLSSSPKQLIAGIQVQEERLHKFTVHELCTMLKAQLGKDNVVDLTNQHLDSIEENK